MHVACHMNHPEVVAALLEQDLLQLEARRPVDGFTPLLVALGTQQAVLARGLLRDSLNVCAP